MTDLGIPPVGAPPIVTHYSALSTHRVCPQKWYFSYALGIRKPDFGPKPEMHLGSWWAVIRAAEALERGRAFQSLKAEPRLFTGVDDGPEFDMRTVTVADVLEAADKWWESRAFEVKEAWQEKLGGGLPERLRALLVKWMDEFATERQNEAPLGVEVSWRRALPRPAGDLEWLGPESEQLPEIILQGTLDEVYLDRAREMVVIRDGKSHKSLARATNGDDMMDSQLQLYGWGALPTIQAWGHGAPRAVGYDRIRSVAPKEPQLTQAGALSKSITDYDLATYLAWAAEDTRPTEEIAKWLERTLPYSEVDPETGEVVEHEPEIMVTREQQDYVRSLPAGRFYGEVGLYLASGPRKGTPKFGVYSPEQDVIDRLSTPMARSTWVVRTLVPLNRNIIAAHLRAAIDTATDAWRTQRRGERVGSVARNLGDACTWCDYAPLSRALMMGGSEGEYDLRDFGLSAKTGEYLLSNGKLVSVSQPA